MKSVTDILSEKYNLYYKPGESHKSCPFCEKNTLTIKGDDTIAKCFHPNCEKSITLRKGGNDFYGELNRGLEEIYHLFREDLIALKKGKGGNAYSYLKKKRNIHPRVIRDAMLGSVPGNFDLKKHFSPLLKKVRTEIKADKNTRRAKRGRPKKPIGPTSKEKKAILKEVISKLETCFSGRAGWLCFFYTDENLQLTSIKLRKPYSKTFVLFKPFERVGVFGLNLFGAEADDCDNTENHLLVLEGEFNQLRLQSVAIRKKGAASLNSIAVGSATGPDLKTLKKIDPNPIICFDNDSSGAGFGLVARAREIMVVTAFTTPGTDSDMDSFLDAFGKDYKKAWAEFTRLLSDAKPYFRSYEGVAQEVYNLRHNKGEFKLSALEIKEQVVRIILDDLLSRGQFFYSDGPRTFYFSREDKKLVEIGQEGFDLVLRLSAYGINRTENQYSYLYETLVIECLTKGQKTEIRKVAHYDSKIFTVYLHNQENQIYRIRPEGIDLVDNGTDGVLFLNDPSAAPFTIQKKKPSKSYLDRLIVSMINFPEDRLSPLTFPPKVGRFKSRNFLL